MHTVVQNDEKDYDIDVAIVFEKDNLNNLGPLATRNMVADALKRKTAQFNAEPVFCKTFLHKIAKTFCRSLQLHFVGNCKPNWQSWYLPAI